jgi:hypothetical protein
MIRPFAYRVLVLAAALAVAATAMVAGQTGSSRVTGRVLAADDGRPVRRAQVRVIGQVTRTTETDAAGRFDVADLPAGTYLVDVEPVVGFVGTPLPPDTVLADRQTREMTIRVDRTGAIEGRIHDESGEPILGVRVEAVRRKELAGQVEMSVNGARATTDDRGKYRLFNLPSGEYYVVASVPTVQRATHAAPPSEESERWGYRPTYHPASATRERAQIVRVRAGRDSRRVDVSLVRSRVSRVSIRTLDSNHAPLGPHSPVLIRRGDVHLDSSTYYGRREPDDTYVFAGVAPGNYDFVASEPQRRNEVAYVKLRVPDTGLSLQVRTSAGARVTGRVIVDGQPAGEALKRSINVGVSAFPPFGMYGPTYADSTVFNLKGSDRFVLTGLRGPMVLSGEVSSGALLSVRRAGEEITGKTLDFDGTEVIDDVVVELTTKVAQLEVSVMGTTAPDEREPVVVLLFPEDSARWHQGYVRYARMSASRRPTRLIRLPAGRYLAVAIHDAAFFNRPTAPGVLERVRPVATPVTLTAGEEARVSLRVTRVSR